MNLRLAVTAATLLLVVLRTEAATLGFDDLAPGTTLSTQYAVSSIQDYAERTEQTVAGWKSMNGLQSGDPAKLAGALVQLASQDEPPLRFAAGADAVRALEQKARDLLAQASAYRELSSSLAHDDA